MTDVNQCTDGTLPFFEVWKHTFVASLLYEGHQHRCGEHIHQPATNTRGAHFWRHNLLQTAFNSNFYHISINKVGAQYGCPYRWFARLYFWKSFCQFLYSRFFQSPLW